MPSGKREFKGRGKRVKPRPKVRGRSGLLVYAREVPLPSRREYRGNKIGLQMNIFNWSMVKNNTVVGVEIPTPPKELVG